MRVGTDLQEGFLLVMAWVLDIGVMYVSIYAYIYTHMHVYVYVGWHASHVLCMAGCQNCGLSWSPAPEYGP